MSKIYTLRKKKNKLAAVIIFSVLISACETSATRKEIDLGGAKVVYVMQNCKPNIKWNGMSVVLEGLNVPKKGDIAFSIGKIDYSEKQIREIKDTVFFYDGLLNSTCQTLVRLSSQEAIERYSLHRDNLLQNFVNTLDKLEHADSGDAAVRAALDGKKKGESLNSKPEVKS